MKRLTEWVWLILAMAVWSCRQMPEADAGQRIVILSPEVAELVAALGATEQIAGVTEECDYPPELRKLPQVGKFGAVKREEILALKPDLVFTSALEQEALTQELAKLGLKVEQVHFRRVTDLPRETMRIGSLLGRGKEAAALADSLDREIRAIAARAAGKPRPRVYLEIYRDPLMSVSDSSFVGGVIETAGGDNVFSRLERDYARVKAEDVVAAAPEIMICYAQDTLPQILARKGWQDIPAIRHKRVYFEADIDPDCLLRATPRTLQAMRRLQEIFEQAGVQ